MHARQRSREDYRHGDLRRALVDAGTELARSHGTNGVVLREVTRAAGVVPNAAYRHFPNRAALIEAVAQHAQQIAARMMREEIQSISPGERGDSDQSAFGHLEAVGRAYVNFALDEPGLFEIAFNRPTGLGLTLATQTLLPDPPEPFSLLRQTIQELQRLGLVGARPSSRAELSAWSAVHGLAVLLTSGPLSGTPENAVKDLIENVLRMVSKGLQ